MGDKNISKSDVTDAIVEALSTKNVRNLKIAVNTQTIFSAKYLFVRVLEVSHKGDSFTPEGDTFTNDEFEIVHGPSTNSSSKAFNIAGNSNASKVAIFTDMKIPPRGAVYVKNIDAYLKNLKETVTQYNLVHSGEYDSSAGLSEQEEVIG
jgi:hypothetical protein